MSLGLGFSFSWLGLTPLAAWIPACGDLCVTHTPAPLGVILSTAKNPTGFIKDIAALLVGAFGFFTLLSFVQNDSWNAFSKITKGNSKDSLRRSDGKHGIRVGWARLSSRLTRGLTGRRPPVPLSPTPQSPAPCQCRPAQCRSGSRTAPWSRGGGSLADLAPPLWPGTRGRRRLPVPV